MTKSDTRIYTNWTVLLQIWSFLFLFWFHKKTGLAAQIKIKSRHVHSVCRYTWLAQWCSPLLTRCFSCYIWSGTGVVWISLWYVKSCFFSKWTQSSLEMAKQRNLLGSKPPIMQPSANEMQHWQLWTRAFQKELEIISLTFRNTHLPCAIC